MKAKWLVVTLMLCLATIPAFGAARTWLGGVNNIWDTTTANWTGAGGVFADGDAVTFNYGTALSSFPQVINIPSLVQPASVTLQWNNGWPSQGQQFVFQGAGGIGGAATVTTSAESETFWFNLQNSYSGLTTIAGSRLVVGQNNALGTTAGGTLVTGGYLGFYNDANYTTAEPVTMQGGSLNNMSGNNIFAGPITMNGNLTVGGNTWGGSLTLAGDIGEIGGSRNLTSSGSYCPSNVILKGTGSWTGSTTMSGGILTAANSHAFDGTSGIALSGGSLGLMGGVKVNKAFTVTANGPGINGAQIWNENGNNEVAGTISLTNNLTILNSSGLVTVSADISGAGRAVNVNGGMAILSGNNSFTGGVGGNGIFVAASNTAFGIGGTVAASYGSSIGLQGNITIANPLSTGNTNMWDGLGNLRNISGTNTINGNVTSSSNYYSAWSSISGEMIVNGNFALGTAATLYFAGNSDAKITLNGTMAAASSLQVYNIIATLGGVSTAMNATAGVNVYNGGSLVLDNTTNNNTNRLGDSTNLTLTGSSFVFKGNSLAPSSEAISTIANTGLFVYGGGNVIDIQHGAGQTAIVTTNNYNNGYNTNEPTGAYLLIKGDNLGNTAGTGIFSKLRATVDPSGQMIGGFAPDNAVPAGTKNLKIYPYMVGASTGTGSGDTFVTYDKRTDANDGGAILGFRPLDLATEYFNDSIAPIQDAFASVGAANGNVRTTISETLAANTTINALLANPGAGDSNVTISANTGAEKLTLTSGALLSTGAKNVTISAPLSFRGSNSLEGVIGVTGAGQVEISSNLTNAYLTKGGPGKLVLSGTNSLACSAGQLSVDGGTVQFSGPNSSLATTATLYMGGGTLDLNGVSQQAVAITGFSNITDSSTGAPSTLTISKNAGSSAFYGTLGGNMNLVKAGTTAARLYGVSNYTGTTTVANGVLAVISNDGLGAVSAPVIVQYGGSLVLGYTYGGDPNSYRSCYYTSPKPLQIAGPGFANTGALTGTYSGSNTSNGSWAGPITLTDDAAIGAGVSLYGAIGESGASRRLTQYGGATYYGAVNHTGGTDLTTSGATITVIPQSAGTFTFGAGTVNIDNNASFMFGAVTNYADDAVLGGNFTIGGGGGVLRVVSRGNDQVHAISANIAAGGNITQMNGIYTGNIMLTNDVTFQAYNNATSCTLYLDGAISSDGTKSLTINTTSSTGLSFYVGGNPLGGPAQNFTVPALSNGWNVKNLTITGSNATNILLPDSGTNFTSGMVANGGKFNITSALNLYKGTFDPSVFNVTGAGSITIVQGAAGGSVTHSDEVRFIGNGLVISAASNMPLVSTQGSVYGEFAGINGNITIGNGGQLTVWGQNHYENTNQNGGNLTLLDGGKLNLVLGANDQTLRYVQMDTAGTHGQKLILGDGNANTPETVTVSGDTFANGAYIEAVGYADDGGVTMKYVSNGANAARGLTIGYTTGYGAYGSRTKMSLLGGSAGTIFAPSTADMGVIVRTGSTAAFTAFTANSPTQLTTAGTVAFTTDGTTMAPIVVNSTGTFDTVAAGTVKASTIAVNGGLIGGIGTFNANAAAGTTVTGGTIRPGNASTAGTLSIAGKLTTDAASTFQIPVGAAAGKVAVNGMLSETAGSLSTVNFSGVTGFTPGNYPIITYTSEAVNVAGMTVTGARATLADDGVSTVSANVSSLLAVPSIPTVYVNKHVGDAAPATANVPVKNAAFATAGYTDALDASVVTWSGLLTDASGSIAGLAAGSTDSMNVNVTLPSISTASAGQQLLGSVTLGLTSNGSSTSGTPANVALSNQIVPVYANVYRYAAPNTLANVTLANIHAGGSFASKPLTIQNTAAADGSSEGLDAAVGTLTGNATAAGSITNLNAGGSVSTMSVGIAGSNLAAGPYSGTATVNFNSNGATTSGLGVSALAGQTINVAGNVYRLASANSLSPTMNLGSFHVGDTAATALTITNTAAADGYSENMDASFGLVTAGLTASGSISALTPGSSDSTMAVAIDTSTAGFHAGSATIKYTSNGTGNSGLGNTVLQWQAPTISAKVFRLATPSTATPNPVNLGIIHKGESFGTSAVTVKNNAVADGYSEGMNATFGSTTGDASSNGGSVTNLAAGATDAASLSVGLAAANTSVAGSKTGTVSLSLASNGTISGLASTALTAQVITVNGQVNEFADAVLGNASGAALSGSGLSYTLDFGTVSEPGAASATLDLTNVLRTVGAPQDLLSGTFDLAAIGSFSATGFGAFTGVAGGSAQTGLSVGFTGLSAGTYNGSIVLTPKSDNTSVIGSSIPGLGSVTLNLTAIIASAAIAGDLNNDGVVNAADIDLEFAAIKAGATDAKYNLNGTGGVDQADADYLVQTILHSQYGDANLTKTVDADDYVVWFNNVGNTAAGWANADFNGSTAVDADDYVLWFNNLGFSYSGSGAGVPEPMTMSLLALGGLAILRRNRK